MKEKQTTPRQQIYLVSPNIKEYIADKRKYLVCNPQYFLHVSSLTKGKNHEEANKHSVSIELVDYNMSQAECLRAKRKERKRCEGQIKNSREWAFLNYEGKLTLDYILQVGKLVEPVVNLYGFRENSVRITGSRCSPPSAEKLTRELNMFLIENSTFESALEKAVHAHFHLARIHPFNDGNGRTSRLIQDTILHQESLPLPIIKLPERGEYIEKIEAAVYSFYNKESTLSLDKVKKLEEFRGIASREHISEEDFENGGKLARDLVYWRMTKEQRVFYDFIALKILSGLSRELNRIYPSEREMIRFLKQSR